MNLVYFLSSVQQFPWKSIEILYKMFNKQERFTAAAVAFPKRYPQDGLISQICGQGTPKAAGSQPNPNLLLTPRSYSMMERACSSPSIPAITKQELRSIVDSQVLAQEQLERSHFKLEEELEVKKKECEEKDAQITRLNDSYKVEKETLMSDLSEHRETIRLGRAMLENLMREKDGKIDELMKKLAEREQDIKNLKSDYEKIIGDQAE